MSQIQTKLTDFIGVLKTDVQLGFIKWNSMIIRFQL